MGSILRYLYIKSGKNISVEVISFKAIIDYYQSSRNERFASKYYTSFIK